MPTRQVMHPSQVRRSFGAIARVLFNLGVSNQDVVEMVVAMILAHYLNLDEEGTGAEEERMMLFGLMQEMIDVQHEIQGLTQALEEAQQGDEREEHERNIREEELIGDIAILEIDFDEPFPSVIQSILEGHAIRIEDVEGDDVYVSPREPGDTRPDVSEVMDSLTVIYKCLKRLHFHLSEVGEDEDRIMHKCLDTVVVGRLVTLGKINIALAHDLDRVNRHVVSLIRGENRIQ